MESQSSGNSLGRRPCRRKGEGARCDRGGGRGVTGSHRESQGGLSESAPLKFVPRIRGILVQRERRGSGGSQGLPAPGQALRGQWELPQPGRQDR